MTEPTQADESCVLVVDDEKDTRDTMQEVVEMIGCTAILASNGAEALTILETRRPCLIIVDLMMPVMSGREMLAAMQQNPALAGVPVFIATSAPHEAPQGIPVMAKPINLHTVWDWMRRSCRCAGGIVSGSQQR